MTMSKKLEITFNSKDNQKISELNQILDKISIQKELSEREQDFLNNYENIDDSEIVDYNYLSLLDLFYLMCKIKKNIVCDIKDKEGKINQLINSVDYIHEDCQIILGLKHGIYTLKDDKLYKLIYEFKHDNYSLDIEGEYYEKINISE